MCSPLKIVCETKCRARNDRFTGDNANVALAFALGYGVTVTSGLISYPIDTIRRRMMMTSGKL